MGFIKKLIWFVKWAQCLFVCFFIYILNRLCSEWMAFLIDYKGNTCVFNWIIKLVLWNESDELECTVPMVFYFYPECLKHCITIRLHTVCFPVVWLYVSVWGVLISSVWVQQRVVLMYRVISVLLHTLPLYTPYVYRPSRTLEIFYSIIISVFILVLSFQHFTQSLVSVLTL